MADRALAVVAGVVEPQQQVLRRDKTPEPTGVTVPHRLFLARLSLMLVAVAGGPHGDQHLVLAEQVVAVTETRPEMLQTQLLT